jgi:ABC-type transport system involved in multi-copper enzyme maturation permease subunit
MPYGDEFLVVLQWLRVFGDPLITMGSEVGGLITWLKTLALLSLVCWIGSWLVTAFKERTIGHGKWFDYLFLAAFVLTPVTVLIRELETAQKLAPHPVAGIPLASFLGSLAAGCFVVWLEIVIWRTLLRYGKYPDLLVAVGLHVGLALGLAVGWFLMPLMTLTPDGKNLPWTWREAVVLGARMSATYMGFFTLARFAAVFFREVLNVRGRRLYAIARVSVHEANRRMWAPWVVVTIFLLVLAFTHWFLQPPRAAELGRLYVGTLILLCSLLLTIMVTILTPLSIPTDIQQQTIYTVVSKPVRRLELIWGRMIGYMAIVSVLVVFFYLISLAYIKRTVGSTIDATYVAAEKAQKEGRLDARNQLLEQAQQLRSRLQARVPVKGSLSFLDSRGTPHAMGIDVGSDQNMKEPRSHIEGATPATAIWSFGIVPDPFTPPNVRPRLLNRRVPVADFLKPDSVEDLLNRVVGLRDQIASAEAEKASPNVVPSKVSQLDASIAANKTLLTQLESDYDRVSKEVAALEAQGKNEEAAQLRSDDVMVEMTFNVYRTTKGKLGEPVYAEMRVTNPHTQATYDDFFPIKEYYTNRRPIPAKVLAGCAGALKIEIHCMSPTQYLGMAESDLYLLSSQGVFGVNLFKGLFGVWLQAMVLTAIGVFAGTFLSWPVALLTTVAFFIAGQIAFSFLVDFTRDAILGGGPFESLIRLVTHDNQMSDLAPTPGVVLAKSLDSLLMPVMSMLVFVVPNFQALDVSNTVADGFAVTNGLLFRNVLLAVAYALPFSIVGYFILKNREVAA